MGFGGRGDSGASGGGDATAGGGCAGRSPSTTAGAGLREEGGTGGCGSLIEHVWRWRKVRGQAKGARCTGHGCVQEVMR
jgi:hypothetical protein